MTAPRVRRRQRSRRNVRMRRLSRPWLETLERRVVLSSVSWIDPNGGDWDTASNWSSGAVPAAGDDVTISIAVTNPITHGSSPSDFVNSITSSDPIVLSAGSLSIAAASTFSNTVTLSGGRLAGGPISMTDGATLVGTGNVGTLSGVTLDGTLDLATNNQANVTITGGLTLNGTVDLGNASGSTYGRLHFVGAQTLGGMGSVILGGNPDYNAITTATSNGDAGTLTIGAGITIHGKYGSIGNSALPLINQGTIADDVSGGVLNVYGTNWTDTGPLQASNGGELVLNGPWTSTASISITANGGGEVVLAGTYSVDAGASIGGSGGTVYFEGTVNSTGTTLALNSASLTYILDGGAIDGGTFAMTDGATLVGTGNVGTLSGVTLDGTLDLATNNQANVTITGGLTLNGTVDLGNASGSTYGRLHFVGAQTLGGMGSVILGGNPDYNAITTATSNGDAGTLTIGAGITIHGKYGSIGNSALPLINQGTIADDVSGGVLNVYGTNWTDTGPLQASNGGELVLNGPWTSTASISITANGGGEVVLAGTYSVDAGASIGGSGGTVYFEGTVNSTGTTLALNSASLTYILDGGAIDGGTFAMTDGATLVGTGNVGTLSGVTLDGTLDLATNNQANVTITGGLTLNGTVNLGNASGSTYGRLHFVGAQTLGGMGSVILGGNPDYNAITTATSNGDAGTLTIGAGITIHGKYGSIGNSALPLINQGTIADDVSGGAIGISGTNWTNSGPLEASGGGELVLTGTWTDTGPITVNTGTVYLEGAGSLGAGAGFSGSGGTVYFEGPLNDAGTTVTLDGAAVTYLLDGGTIDGGTSAMTDGATLVGTGNVGTLSGVTLDGTLDLATNNQANVTITGGLTLNGTIDLGNASGSTYGRLHFVGAQTLGGMGSVILGGNPDYNAITTATSNGDAGTLTIGAGITIHGKYGSIGNSALPLINQGTIDADVSGGEIDISGTNWTNSGTITANAGTINLSGTGTNFGALQGTNGGTLSSSGGALGPVKE